MKQIKKVPSTYSGRCLLRGFIYKLAIIRTPSLAGLYKLNIQLITDLYFIPNLEAYYNIL